VLITTHVPIHSSDMLADCNLWSAAALMQLTRAFLPMGIVFTPIMDELVYLITALESSTIEKVSFYKSTSAFVNFLKNSTSVDQKSLQVTGHSLGGGLCM
jgi:lipase ATG15